MLRRSNGFYPPSRVALYPIYPEIGFTNLDERAARLKFITRWRDQTQSDLAKSLFRGRFISKPMKITGSIKMSDHQIWTLDRKPQRNTGSKNARLNPSSDPENLRQRRC